MSSILTQIRPLIGLAILTALASMHPLARAQSTAGIGQVLSAEQSHGVDQSVARALEWLAGQQKSDGSFPTENIGQPGVTSLCVMAFLASGHTPGHGPYGDNITRAIDFVLSTQKNNGMIAYVSPRPDNSMLNSHHTAMYNHGISGTMLCEVYGMSSPEQSERIKPVLLRALNMTINGARTMKNPYMQGGWRYDYRDRDSDLSITCWQLMFLRSAANAGFDVPIDVINEGVNFVQRCAQPQGGFTYAVMIPGSTPAMSGAGILALALSGLHETESAKKTGRYIMDTYFNSYLTYNTGGRYHYEIYHCTLGLYQLGGDLWRQWYPKISSTLVSAQSSGGSWQPEPGAPDRMFGNCYTTALAVQVLAAPFQLVPIYQR